MKSTLEEGFWFLVCYDTTQLVIQLPQERIQVVRSNKIARKRLTESNGTPAMDFECEEIRKRRYTQTKNRTKHTNIVGIEVLLLILQFLCGECVLLCRWLFINLF